MGMYISNKNDNVEIPLYNILLSRLSLLKKESIYFYGKLWQKEEKTIINETRWFWIFRETLCWSFWYRTFSYWSAKVLWFQVTEKAMHTDIKMMKSRVNLGFLRVNLIDGSGFFALLLPWMCLPLCVSFWLFSSHEKWLKHFLCWYLFFTRFRGKEF